MRQQKMFRATALGMTACALLLLAFGRLPGFEKKVKWVGFEQALTTSAKEKKLLVVDFYTDWCHLCKVMERETYGDDNVLNYSKEKVIFSKINAETTQKFKFRDGEYSGRELAMMFGVQGFPMTAFIGSDGELITTLQGVIPAEKFRLILQYLAEDWYKEITLEEFEKREE